MEDGSEPTNCLRGASHVRRLAAMMGLALASTLALAPRASADSPIFESQQLVRVLVTSCPSFDVIGEFHVVRSITTFVDADGLPIRRVIHGSFDGSRLINASSGEWVPADGVRVITFDLLNGGLTSTGTNVHVVLPGEGTLQLGAGRFELDATGHLIFEAGRLDPPTTDALCAALTG